MNELKQFSLVLSSISDFHNVLMTPMHVNEEHTINKQANDNTLGETGVDEPPFHFLSTHEIMTQNFEI